MLKKKSVNVHVVCITVISMILTIYCVYSYYLDKYSIPSNCDYKYVYQMEGECKFFYLSRNVSEKERDLYYNNNYDEFIEEYISNHSYTKCNHTCMYPKAQNILDAFNFIGFTIPFETKEIYKIDENTYVLKPELQNLREKDRTNIDKLLENIKYNLFG